MNDIRLIDSVIGLTVIGLTVMELIVGVGFTVGLDDRSAEQFSDAVEEMAIAGTEQTIVAHLDEAIGEDVVKEAANELFSGDGRVSDLISG